MTCNEVLNLLCLYIESLHVQVIDRIIVLLTDVLLFASRIPVSPELGEKY